MANKNCLAGMACPNCKSEGPFTIAAQVMVLVADDGTEDIGGDYEWTETATCICKACGHIETVKDFTL
jgi:hypothetical protein